ncbi:MAG: response regulator transcription factor [Thiohalobacterales bacterium]|nr:response regulator transcription factor [Thiohalobacterales bacterium]
MAAYYPAGTLYDADEPRSTRVLIIASRDLFVDGIIRILESSRDDVHVTCIPPGEPCSSYFTGESPDLLLLQDKSRPEPFEDFIRETVEGFPELRLLVFGQTLADDYLYRIIHAGAHGYINDRMKGEHMLEAIETVMGGHYWVERHIMERFIVDSALVDGVNSRMQLMGQRLTNREAEVLGLVLKGLSTNEIAERIFLSHQGVKAHLTTLFRKFGVRNRPQLILRAVDEASPVESITGLMREGLEAARSART